MTESRYIIKDIRTGHIFYRSDDYYAATAQFWHVVDFFEYPKDDTYLQLVDTQTGRAVSVV